jgi:hypothetical protein
MKETPKRLAECLSFRDEVAGTHSKLGTGLPSTALELVDVEPPIGLGQEGLAVLTEKERGTVEVAEAVRGTHDTLRLFTVNESEGVCQFVNSHLGDTFVKGIEAHTSAALSLAKAIERNHRRPSPELGLAKDVGEHGNEQVHVHHAQQTLMGTAARGKPLENKGGIILPAPVVKGKIRVSPAGKDVHGEVEQGLEVSGNDSHNRISPGT